MIREKSFLISVLDSFLLMFKGSTKSRVLLSLLCLVQTLQPTLSISCTISKVSTMIPFVNIPFNRVLNRSVAWAGSTDTGKPGEPPEPQQRGGERRERYPGEAGGAQGGEEQ